MIPVITAHHASRTILSRGNISYGVREVGLRCCGCGDSCDGGVGCVEGCGDSCDGGVGREGCVVTAVKTVWGVW